jgi:uncharacterized protein YegL
MPKFGDSKSLQTHKAGHFGFSAVRIEDLLATEYTLVTVIVDRSGSTKGFQTDMEKALKQIVDACRKSPRADNLMVRIIAFDDSQQEIHGFKLLNDIAPVDYDGILSPGGMTALFDATIDGIEATSAFGKQLLDQDYDVNGIVFVITDGMENKSKLNDCHYVRQAFEKAVKGENLESLVSILIAVNLQEPDAQKALEDFNVDAGFTQFVDIGAATPQKLAKLAQFVSKSISSQSQALGTGGPSQSLNV